MKYWHVLFVRGGYEHKITAKINDFDSLEKCEDTKVIEAFLPKVVKCYKRQKSIIKEEALLFKNYVFVRTDLDYQDFLIYLHKHIQSITGFIKLLKHDQVGTETLLPHERQFLEKFTNQDDLIESSIGFIEGDTIIITEGPLVGHESQIKKIDRHKRLATLDISMFGRPQSITVALEIISKT